MNKEKIIRIVNELGLENKYHHVFMGGSLAMRGIRDTRDLDIGVDKKTFKDLIRRFNVEELGLYKSALSNRKFDLVVLDEDVEVFELDNEKEFDIIEGIKVQKIEDIIKLKKSFGREKDLIDLELISKRAEDF